MHACMHASMHACSRSYTSHHSSSINSLIHSSRHHSFTHSIDQSLTHLSANNKNTTHSTTSNHQAGFCVKGGFPVTNQRRASFTSEMHISAIPAENAHSCYERVPFVRSFSASVKTTL